MPRKTVDNALVGVVSQKSSFTWRRILACSGDLDFPCNMATATFPLMLVNYIHSCCTFQLKNSMLFADTSKWKNKKLFGNILWCLTKKVLHAFGRVQHAVLLHKHSHTQTLACLKVDFNISFMLRNIEKKGRQHPGGH